MPNYALQPGDCCSRIADSLGATDYHAIYDLPENASLRASVPNPNQLMASGTIFVPPSRAMCAADGNAAHQFTCTFRGVKLRIRLVDGAEHPGANLNYTLTVGSVTRNGRTDAHGQIEADIEAAPVEGTLVVHFPPRTAPAATPPAASTASPPPYPAPLDPAAFIDARDDAYIGGPASDDLTWHLRIGSLATFGELQGVQGRLLNLGIGNAPVNGSTSDALTAAVRAYQTHYHLTVDGNWESIKTDLRTRHDQP